MLDMLLEAQEFISEELLQGVVFFLQTLVYGEIPFVQQLAQAVQMLAQGVWVEAGGR